MEDLRLDGAAGLDVAPTRAATVADEIAWDAMPQYVRAMAERVLRERLYDDGFQAGRDDGYNSGAEQGFKDGYAQARQDEEIKRKARRDAKAKRVDP